LAVEEEEEEELDKRYDMFTNRQNSHQWGGKSVMLDAKEQAVIHHLSPNYCRVRIYIYICNTF
jgi:hypothetical protein